jgi:type VI secretion system protein ImpF
MAKARTEDALVPSVLDRLIDDEPTSRVDPPRNDFQIVRGLKAGVRRDLENLLNTRWRCVGWPKDLAELELSLVNYGIPDFTGANLGSTGSREDFVRVIHETIRRFEPRLRRVHVELMDNEDSEDRTMRFRIDAVLMADPEPLAVVFDSTLEPSSGTFQIRGGSDE